MSSNLFEISVNPTEVQLKIQELRAFDNDVLITKMLINT